MGVAIRQRTSFIRESRRNRSLASTRVLFAAGKYSVGWFAREKVTAAAVTLTVWCLDEPEIDYR